MPTYNRLPDLKKCLDSIINGFKNEDYPYEIIIADGGSTDGTIEYVKSLGDIHLIEQKGELTGAVKACNVCFRAAKGKYITIGTDDFIFVPKTVVKACKLMDKEKQIGLVSPKLQEPTYRSLHWITLKMKRFWAVIPKMFIVRSSVFKQINYFDETFRTYRVDDDTPLSFMKLGHTIIFTRDVGIIHNRTKDEINDQVRAINYNVERNKREFEYFLEKYESLEKSLEKYLKNSPFTKRKALFLAQICDSMYRSKILKPFVEANNDFSLNVQDWILDKAVIFRDHRYDNLKDFYLPQKYPDEVLSSLN
jgi:GT2 family glycosyltransferase